VLVCRGKAGRRRGVGMDDWACEQLERWLAVRVELPVGPLFCVLAGARGRTLRPASSCGIPPRSPACGADSRPISSRHAHAVEMAREGVSLIVIGRQLGHTNLAITSIYLHGSDSAEIIDTVHARRPPVVPVDSSLSL
jgi:site-specific recombinase XerD